MFTRVLREVFAPLDQTNINFRDERAVHRASLRDIEESCALIFGQLPGEFETPVDAIDMPLFGLAFGTVDGVDPEIPQIDADLLKWPILASRIQRDRHRRSTAERRDQQLVGSWARISAAKFKRLV